MSFSAVRTAVLTLSLGGCFSAGYEQRTQPAVDGGRTTRGDASAQDAAGEPDADGASSSEPCAAEGCRPHTCDEEPRLCNLECQANESACSFDCEAGYYCNPTCSEPGSCTVACAHPNNNCGATCTSQAACEVDCQTANSCAVSCEAGSTCFVNCNSANECEDIACSDDAECLLQCSLIGDQPVADCAFSRCADPTYCGNGLTACNRSCP